MIRKQYSSGMKMFTTSNYIFLIFAACICIFPMIHVLAISFSSSNSAASGMVGLFPVGFTTKSYEYVLTKKEFWTALLISVKRVLVGVPVNMILICLVAYPLSRKSKDFRLRNFYAWFFVFTALFSGGLIPMYVVVFKTGLINSLWSLIIPGAVPVFSVIILLNFFKQLPAEIEESAFIDGAGHWTILTRMYIPLSIPSLATLLLFSCVGHWNSWFDGIIFMNRPEKLPIQSYLQTVVIASGGSMSVNLENIEAFSEVSDRTYKAAQIFIGTLPILIVYPFLQKYFMTGIVLGSVKG